MDRSGLKAPASAGLITLAQGLLKIWFKTCRLNILKEEFHNEAVSGNRQYIGVTWHRAAIFYCFFYGPLHPMIMFSQSQDGEYLTRFAQKCGVIPVRGSSTRGGLKALIQMIRYLKDGNRMCATQALEDFRLEIQNRLNTLMDELDKACGYKTRWEDEGSRSKG